ncbi:unnamed protein product, partial [Bubo scandiacus]
MQIVRWLYLSGLGFAVLIPAGWQMGPEDLDATSRWQSYESQSAQSFASNIKRHSEGTFSSDFTRYLDKMKAKDFVHWLINTKRFSSTKRYLKEEPRTVPLPLQNRNNTHTYTRRFNNTELPLTVMCTSVGWS